MSRSRGALRIGTSGYQYDHWRGVLYPPGLPKRAWFARYAEVFDTVEVNNTFYRVPSREVFEAWRARCPDGFVYVLKFSRFATHMKKLKDPEQTVGYFLDRAEPLLDRVGAILVHLPPRFPVNPERLDAFLATTPKHLRWAVELRDRTWLTEEVYDVLRRHQAALCIHDILVGHPWVTTTSWTYLRFHGRNYDGAYTDAQLRDAAIAIERECASGRDVFAFFNNDLGGHAVRDATRLRALVGGARPELAPA